MSDKMKTKVVPLIGDPIESLYQLGLTDREAFLQIESRVSRLLSSNPLLSYGQDLLSRARVIIGTKEKKNLFHQCVVAYAKGMGIDPVRYFSFLSLFEIAAHHSQTYPELKPFVPGCSSVLEKKEGEFIHTRLLDFPLTGIYEENPRLYLWQIPGQSKVLTYSTAGLAPLFLQGLHESGMSFALHHKPGETLHKEGKSIFEILFQNLIGEKDSSNIRKNLKRQNTFTKWGIVLLGHDGQVQEIDLDGPAQTSNIFNLNDNSPLIFTNIPLKQENSGHEEFLAFTESRQHWISEKLKEKGRTLDLLTDVTNSKGRGFKHPGATLSTVGAYSTNLTKGLLHFKEGTSALVSSDPIFQMNLGGEELSLFSAAKAPSEFEAAWKRLALAQGHFDQGQFDLAYHEIYMAEALMPSKEWKEIIKFFIAAWDFRFLKTKKELLIVYKALKELKLPFLLLGQWQLLIMRFERKLGLVLTVKEQDLPAYLIPLYKKERDSGPALFATWMKLLYPRMEILTIFSPHSK